MKYIKLQQGAYLGDPKNQEDAPEYYSSIEPAVKTAPLPKKFHGSQTAAKQYAEGYQGAQKNVVAPREKAAPTVAKALAATFTAPIAIDLATTAIANPYVRTGLDVIGTVDGVKNLVSKNGIQKTIKLAKTGDIKGAIKSGVGDTLDLAGTGDLIRMARRFRPANRALHAFAEIPPIGYNNPIKRGKKGLKSVFEDKPINIDSPVGYDRYFKQSVGQLIPFSEIGNTSELAGRTRFDAGRLYNKLPQKYNSYIKNADGTYSYNLKQIQELVPDMKPDLFTRYDTFDNTIDTFTSAGGNLEQDNLYNFGKNLTNPKINYELREIEDTGDLHPFAEGTDGDFKDSILNPLRSVQEKVQNNRRYMFDRGIFGFKSDGFLPKITSPINSAMNRFRNGTPNVFDTKAFSNITERIKRLEVGKISGGEPFKMRTEVPHTIDLTDPNKITSHFGFIGEDTPASVSAYNNGQPLQAIVKQYNLPKLDMAHIKDLSTPLPEELPF